MLLADLDPLALLVLLDLLAPPEPLERMALAVPVVTLDLPDPLERMAWLDLTVPLETREPLERLVPLVPLDPPDLRVSSDLRDSTVFPVQEATVVFPECPVLLVMLADLDLLVLLDLVVPLATLACLV